MASYFANIAERETVIQTEASVKAAVSKAAFVVIDQSKPRVLNVIIAAGIKMIKAIITQKVYFFFINLAGEIGIVSKRDMALPS